MQKLCQNCQSPFEISDEDLDFYDRISPVFNGKKYAIPAPTHCPDCRQQRRLAFRNERNLYYDTCNLTGKRIVSIYHPDSPFLVYDRHEWEKQEKWDPISFGRDFDFSRSFFDQYKDFQKVVPRRANNTLTVENSDYCNHIWHTKNSYLCINMGYSEDCLYCQEVYYSQNMLDCLDVIKSELCAYCYLCQNCYNGLFLENCQNCSDAMFSINCRDCRNIILCSNLRGKQYCILNKQYSRDEYLAMIAKMSFGKHSYFSNLRKKFDEVKRNTIYRENFNIQAENCRGDYLVQSKDMQNCFHCYKSQNCKYVHYADSDVKDCYDFDYCAELELSYEGTCVAGYMQCFSTVTARGGNNFYCDSCESTDYCFGCIGLKHKKYCILNKQYSKEEYEELVPQIISHMRSPILCQGYEGRYVEWGEFFPIWLSPQAYNDTLAQREFPVSKDVALQKGYQWREEKERNFHHQTMCVPDDIADISDEILDAILECEKCGKNYKIIEQELKFYKQMGIPIPRECADCRIIDLSALRNSSKLTNRTCKKCGKGITTTYSFEKPEKVYCEGCYLKEVY